MWSLHHENDLSSHGDQEVPKSKMAFGHNNCGKDFVRNTSQHSIIHSEGQTSDENGKGINLVSDLELQQQLQEGEEPRMYSEYGKGLSQSSHMQTHQRANPGEKPYNVRYIEKCPSSGPIFWISNVNSLRHYKHLLSMSSELHISLSPSLPLQTHKNFSQLPMLPSEGTVLYTWFWKHIFSLNNKSWIVDMSLIWFI